jgi:hypothetical protein
VHEVLEVVVIRAARLGVGDVRKPLDLGRDVGQVEKILRGECGSVRIGSGLESHLVQFVCMSGIIDLRKSHVNRKFVPSI